MSLFITSVIFCDFKPSSSLSGNVDPNPENKTVLTVTAEWEDNIEFTFDYTGNIQSLTIPKTGYYKLEAWGAQGGASYAGGGWADYYNIGYNGGYESGAFLLNKSSTLKILIGGAGYDNTSGTGNWIAGGGGGGSFLYTTSMNALIVAGGGAGAHGGSWENQDETASVGGQTTTNILTDGNQSLRNDTLQSVGAGFTIQTSSSKTGFILAKSVKNGGSGCIRDTYDNGVSGGYGGGGCSATFTGGAGGGYYGGMVSDWTAYMYGGSSFNNSTNQKYKISKRGNESMPNPRGSGNITGNVGNGYARITYLGASI